jgi:hypothetical protein
MRKYLFASLIVASIGAVGCDKTLSSNEKTTTSPNGAQTTTEQKTVQHPDGSVSTEKQVQHNSGASNPNQ